MCGVIDDFVGMHEFEASWSTENRVVFVVHASILEDPASSSPRDESEGFIEDDVAKDKQLTSGETVEEVRSRR